MKREREKKKDIRGRKEEIKLLAISRVLIINIFYYLYISAKWQNRKCDTKQDDRQIYFRTYFVKSDIWKKKREREKENVVHCWRFPSRGTVMYINIHIAYIHYIHTHVHTYMHTYIKRIYFSGYKERKRKKWENKKKNNCKYVSDLVDAIKIYYKSIMHGHQGVD